jgi:hypothetical protein
MCEHLRAGTSCPRGSSSDADQVPNLALPHRGGPDPIDRDPAKPPASTGSRALNGWGYPWSCSFPVVVPDDTAVDSDGGTRGSRLSDSLPERVRNWPSGWGWAANAARSTPRDGRKRRSASRTKSRAPSRTRSERSPSASIRLMSDDSAVAGVVIDDGRRRMSLPPWRMGFGHRCSFEVRRHRPISAGGLETVARRLSRLLADRSSPNSEFPGLPIRRGSTLRARGWKPDRCANAARRLRCSRQ